MPVGGFDVSAAANDQAASKKRDNGLSPLGLSLLPLLVLFAATVVLFWLSQRDMSGTYKYWEIFVPVVALVSLVSGWGQAYANNNNRLWYVLRQVIHWGAVIGLLYLLNTQGYRELLTDQQYTALMIYLLALGALLASVQLDIKLVFFAVFLAYCAFLVAVPDNNPALVSAGEVFGISDPQTKPVMVTSALAAVGFVASIFVLFAMRGAIIARHAVKKRNKGD
jgi:hypothetical protein